MFKLNNCRWRMALAAIVALSIGFSSQAAEIDQRMQESKSCALPLGDSPLKEKRVGSGTRTHDLRNHNPTR